MAPFFISPNSFPTCEGQQPPSYEEAEAANGGNEVKRTKRAGAIKAEPIKAA